MEFHGPCAVDYQNVQSLNQAFLTLIRRAPAANCPGGIPAPVAAKLLALTEHQAARLAAVPFLLLSFRERDDAFWEQALDECAHDDLFAAAERDDDARTRLLAAGLGFAWQLARQNPYAARLICGASLSWCERLSERTLVQTLALATGRVDLPEIRGAADTELWARLLGDGIARDARVRRAAHISALHVVLTRSAIPAARRWPIAACGVKRPSICRERDSDE